MYRFIYVFFTEIVIIFSKRGNLRITLWGPQTTCGEESSEGAVGDKSQTIRAADYSIFHAEIILPFIS